MVKFLFGKPTRSLEDFFDREDLVGSVVDYVLKGQSYALVGFRRTGKTSILYALDEILRKKGTLTAFVDLELRMERGYLDPVSFLRSYHFSILEDYFSQMGLLIKLKHLIREAPSKTVMALSEVAGRVRSAKVKAESAIGSLELHVEFEKTVYENRPRGEIEDSLLETVLKLPEKLGEEAGKKFVVFIDEFQFIRDLKNWRKGIFHTMRSVYQHQKNTAYVVSGSAVGMISDILNSKENPFYMAFMPVEVKPFPPDVAKKYLAEGFRAEKLSTSEVALDQLVQGVDGVPAWLSYVGQKCVFTAKEQKTRSIDEKLATGVTERMYDDPFLKAEIEKDLSKLEGAVKSRRILQVLEIMAKQNVSSPSQITQALSERGRKSVPESKVLQLYLARLIEYGYVQRAARGEYIVVDPILVQYLRRK